MGKISFKVEKIEKPIYDKGILGDEETAYTGIKITAKNLGNEEIKLAGYSFTLLDSNNNELDSQNLILSRYVGKFN